MSDDELPETLATYLRLRGLEPTGRGRRRRRRTVEGDENAPFSPGRDPARVGDVLASFTRQAGWDPDLAREDVVTMWAEVVGEANAARTRPTGFRDGVLLVSCDSTAWVSQLKLMRRHILTTIVQRFPEAGIDNITFQGPDVPSWKHGMRAVPGRGPRDTYG